MVGRAQLAVCAHLRIVERLGYRIDERSASAWARGMVAYGQVLGR